MRSGVVLAVVCLMVASARAEPVKRSERPAEKKRATVEKPVRPDPKGQTPWSRGVPQAAQQRALQLFREGNVFFEQAKYTDAVEKYEKALVVWDHPNIRFNMAICLIYMRQPLVAWSHLQQALRFGDAPLGERLHTEGMRYVALLESSLAQLTVRTSQPDVSIMVDGGQVLTGAGEHTMKLLAGKHQLVASRAGFVTESRALDLSAGKQIVEDVALLPEKVKVEVRRENYERRWRWWVPWTVTGASVPVALIGTALYVSAGSQMKQYDREFAELCPEGCEVPADLARKRDAATRKSGIGIAFWTGAGALAIAGGAMAILNRPRKLEDRRAVPTLAVSRDYVGIGVSLALE